MAAEELLETIIGRVILLAHSICTIGYTAYFLDNGLYWLFVFLLLFQVFEMVYMVAKRRCVEYSWISVSTVCYLIAVVPPMWTIEIKVLTDFQLNITSNQATNKTSLRDYGFDIEDSLGRELLKQSFLLLIVIHRWVIPKGASMSKDDLSNLVFSLFALASDVLDLFELFNNVKVKRDGVIGYAILAVWTLSLTQMCFVLTNTRLSRREKPSKDDSVATVLEATAEDRSCVQAVVETEIWGMLLGLAAMDVPFLIIRLYVIIHLEVITYGIIFYVYKNILVMLLSVYRMVVICLERKREDDEHEEEVWSKKMSALSDQILVNEMNDDIVKDIEVGTGMEMENGIGKGHSDTQVDSAKTVSNTNYIRDMLYNLKMDIVTKIDNVAKMVNATKTVDDMKADSVAKMDDAIIKMGNAMKTDKMDIVTKMDDAMKMDNAMKMSSNMEMDNVTKMVNDDNTNNNIEADYEINMDSDSNTDYSKRPEDQSGIKLRFVNKTEYESRDNRDSMI